MADEGSRMTTNGLNLLAQCIADQNKTLHFRKIEVGDALSGTSVVVPTASQILSRTKLVNKKLELELTDVQYHSVGTVVCKCHVTNTGITEGFWLREIGLYASIGATGSPVLYSYKNYGDLATWISAEGGSTVVNFTISLITVIDQVTNISATINKNLIYVTQADLDAHINNTDPHPRLISKGKVVTSSDNFWAAGDDGKLHQITKANMQTQLLGSAAYILPHLDSRIAQNEINISNLYAELNALTSNGLDANLFFAEDFDECRFCDVFNIEVDDATQSISNVCIDPKVGISNENGRILVGHYYTITDGSHSQRLLVDGIVKTKENIVVQFTEPLAYQYKKGKTRLRRSTGTIIKQKLSGAKNYETTSVSQNKTWAGTAAGTVTNTLETELENKSFFTLSGDWDFTEDGQFTLK